MIGIATSKETKPSSKFNPKLFEEQILQFALNPHKEISPIYSEKVYAVWKHLNATIQIDLPLDSSKCLWCDRSLSLPKPIYGFATAKPDILLVSKNGNVYPISIKTSNSWVAASVQNFEEFQGLMHYGMKTYSHQISFPIQKTFIKLYSNMHTFIGQPIPRNQPVNMAEIIDKCERKKISIPNSTKQHLFECTNRLNEKQQKNLSKRQTFKKISFEFSHFLDEQLALKKGILLEALSGFHKYRRQVPYYAQYILSEKYGTKLSPNSEKLDEYLSDNSLVKFNIRGLPMQRNSRTVKMKKILAETRHASSESLYSLIEKLFFNDMISMLKIDVREPTSNKG